MNTKTRQFAVLMSGTHAIQHFLNRILPPLIPILALSLDSPFWKLGMLVTLSSLGSGLGQAPVGVLSDRYDRRYLLPTGLGVAAGSYVLFGLSPTLGKPLPTIRLAGLTFTGAFLLMCVTMVLTGLGRSVVHPTGYPMISSNVPQEHKGKVLGMWGSAAKVGDAGSPAVIAVLILVLAWTDIVVMLGVIGVVYSAILFVVLGRKQFETTPPEHTDNQIDSESTDQTESENVLKGDKRVFVFPILAVLGFFIARMIASKGVNTFVPTFITEVYGYSFTLFGFAFAPESFASFYFSVLLLTAAGVQLVTGALTDRYDHRMILISFMLVSAVALFVLAFVILPPLLLLITLLFIGGGIWGLNPARDALISDITPAAREGRTFGYLWTGSQLIGAFIPIIVGYIADVSSIQNSFQYLGFGAILAAGAIALLYSERIYVSKAPDSAQAAGE